MKITRKIRKISGTYYVSIPKAIVEYHNLNKNDVVTIELQKIEKQQYDEKLLWDE